MYNNKEIWNVSYPILLALLAQNIINVTDTAFLGHVGEVELGASAMGGLLYICVFTIAFGFSTGSQIMIARRNGEGHHKDVGPVMIQGCLFLFITATIIAVLPVAGTVLSVISRNQLNSCNINNHTPISLQNKKCVAHFISRATHKKRSDSVSKGCYTLLTITSKTKFQSMTKQECTLFTNSVPPNAMFIQLDVVNK